MDSSPSRIELTPLSFLRRNAQALGQRPAVVHGERRFNYAELEERCNRMASALREKGRGSLKRILEFARVSTARQSANSSEVSGLLVRTPWSD